MDAAWIEKLTGSLDQKQSYRRYRARKATLPAQYREAVDAFERYLTFYGAISVAAVLVTMLEDLVELFEQGAADATPIRGIVGDDPVEFAEEFLRNYADGQWISKERARLTDAIDRAELMGS